MLRVERATLAHAMIWNRVRGLLRDAFFLPPLVLLTSALVAWKISAVVAIVTIIASAAIFVYFAILRYDDEGNERTTGV